LENLTLPKNDNAKETDKILQTQLTWNFAIKRHADFENLQNHVSAGSTTNHEQKLKPRNKANQNLRWPKAKPKNLDADFSDSMKPNENFANKRNAVEQKAENLKTCLRNKDSNFDLKKHHR